MQSFLLVLGCGLLVLVLLPVCPSQAQVWTQPLPIMDLAGAGDLLVAATQGGVVSWSRATPGASQVLTTAHGLPTQVALTARLNPQKNELMVTTTNGAARGWFARPWTTLEARPEENGTAFFSSLALPGGGWVLGADGGKLVAWRGAQVDSLKVPTNTGRVIAVAIMPQWIESEEQRQQSTSLFPSGLVAVLDNDGIWLWMSSGTPKWRRLDTASGLLPDLIVDAVADDQGALWIATRSGIARMQQPGILETFPLDSILSQRALALFMAPNGFLYIGLRSGLARVVPGLDPPFTEMTVWAEGPVTSIACNDEGVWWSDGYVVRSSSGAELAVPSSLAGGQCLSVAASGSTTWVGHPAGRLSRFDAGDWERFSSTDGLPPSDINSLVLFHGVLHVGTPNGVYVEELNGNETRFRALGAGPAGNVQTLALRDGVLLAGTSEGLWEYGNSGWQFLPLWPGAREVQDLVVADVLWASAGEGGVAFHNRHGWHPVALDSALCSRSFTVMQRHEDGRIAVGTDCGVALWDGGVLRRVAGGPSGFVHAVHWWGDALAVGTNSGLWIRRANGAWVWQGIFDGLAGAKIRALAPGRGGRLWIASTRGIATLQALGRGIHWPPARTPRPHHSVSAPTIPRDPNHVRLDLPKASSTASVHIYDIRGRLVRSLSGRAQQETVSWDGRDARGHRVARGVYFVRSEHGRTTQTRRVVWLR